MKFRVILQRLALRDLDEAYSRAARNAPETALKWLERFQASFESLTENPDRFPLANESARSPVELREFHFGRRSSIFRIIFAIDQDFVRVLRIRRAQQKYMSRQEIDAALDQSSNWPLNE